MLQIPFSGFFWDKANRSKCQKHGVPIAEIEYVLAHTATLMMPDTRNSEVEDRFLAIGQTSQGRYAFVIFHATCKCKYGALKANQRALHAP